MLNNPFIRTQEDSAAKIDRSAGGSSEWQLAAVYAVNTENTAVTLLLDGTDEPTQKYYKVLTGAWPLAPDDRVIVLKMSGTYVVVGKIGGEPVTPVPTFTAEPNTVFAGPTSGTDAGEAAFRKLVKDDLPGGGGGDMETIITENIFTPVTNVTASSKIAVCGKFGQLMVSALYTKNLTKEANSSNIYKIGTIADGYRPATKVTKAVAFTRYQNRTSGTESQYEVLIGNMIIDEDGVIFVDVVPSYSSTSPNPRDRYVYTVSYLLP